MTTPDGGGTGDREDRDALVAVGMGLAWWAAEAPDRVAVVSPTGTRTFETLNAGANRLVRALRTIGLVAGDAVALLCANRPEFVETVYACQRAGWRLTPINWHLTAGEVAYIVADCGARVLVTDAERAAVAVESVQAGSRPLPVVVAGGGPGSRMDSSGLVVGYDELTAGERADDVDQPALGTTMLYTSGTTGRPKGVLRPPTAASAVTAPGLFGYQPERGDLHLCTGPLYHAAPLAFSLAAPLANGTGVVLMDHFDASEALALVAEHRITHTHMVPTMFHRLLSLPEKVRTSADTSSLRFVLHGAAPCPVHVKQRLIEWLGPVVWEYYAATEGLGTLVDSATWLAHPGTVGRPMVDGQVMVADEAGNAVAPGVVGLVYLHAPPAGRFEYFGDPDKTAAAFTGDYFTLGDVGYLDDEGFLYLTDRSADLIITGGVNVYPADIDAVLLEHPAVADAACVGVPDPEWGESVVAVVEPKAPVGAGDELAAELVEFCRQRLAHFKCPRRVVLVDALPRQDNGKIYRRLVRQRLAEIDGVGRQ